MTSNDETMVTLEEELILIAVRNWTSWCMTDISKMRLSIFGDHTRKSSAIDCLKQLEHQVTRTIEISRRQRKERKARK